MVRGEMKKLSRQSQMIARRRAAGLCLQCGKVPPVTQSHCQPCREKHSEYQTKVNRAKGCKPWQVGGRGRPPLNQTKPKGEQL